MGKPVNYIKTISIIISFACLLIALCVKCKPCEHLWFTNYSTVTCQKDGLVNNECLYCGKIETKEVKASDEYCEFIAKPSEMPKKDGVYTQISNCKYCNREKVQTKYSLVYIKDSYYKKKGGGYIAFTCILETTDYFNEMKSKGYGYLFSKIPELKIYDKNKSLIYSDWAETHKWDPWAGIYPSNYVTIVIHESEISNYKYYSWSLK